MRDVHNMETDEAARRASSFPVAWKRCNVCREGNLPSKYNFKSPRDFCRHLREFHCTREGGSFICRYGPHGVCLSLPVEGVSDRDYEDHVARDHVAEAARGAATAARLPASTNSTTPAVETPANTEPSVVQDQHRWTAYMSKVNLPAALNDPRLTRRETDFFTKTWGEAFIDRPDVKPSNHLPEITRDHFKKYLRKTSARHKDHIRVSTTTAPSGGEGGLPTDEFPLLHASRQREKSRSELEAIPKIFMMPNMSLDNVDTFNAVFPWTQIGPSRGESGESAKRSSKLLQEKLSHYLDVVEVQIARQISLRSEAFFHAMSSHDILEERMKETCATIKILREKIRELDSKMIHGPLSVMKQARTRNNYMKLYHKLKLMATVHQTQPTIQMLLSTNEFVGALDLIGTTQEVLTQELMGIHSFRHLGSQLAEMEKVIDKMLQGEFVKYASADLNRPLSEEDRVMEEDMMEIELTENQEKLVSIVFGMVRQKQFNFVDIYREEACTALKAIVKQSVVKAVAAADDIDNENNAGSLADQMRLLNYPAWMDLLRNVFGDLTVVLRRVKAVAAVMTEVAQVAAGVNRLNESGASDVVFDLQTAPAEVNGFRDTPPPEANGEENAENTNGEGNPNSEGNTNGEATTDENPPLQSPTTSSVRVSVGNDMDVIITGIEYGKLSASLRDMLCAVCDHAHDRCVKLLVARGKDGFLERLSSGEFVQLSRAVECFVSDSEQVCGRRSTSLRASLQSQANKFVNRFHEERKTKLTLILDNERWKQADVPAEFQHLVSHICEHQQLSIPEDKPHPDTKPLEYLLVDDDKFAVVGTVLMLLKMVVEYCQCAVDIPAVTPDLLSRVIELLKMFNSRTCQLILGAGALQLVGLKTITTKNLALASRCLQLVVHFLPVIRIHFITRLSGKQTNMLKHFDSVTKDYNDHIAEIANKLLAIMDSMLDMQLAKWEVKPPMPSTSFRSICKQNSKLHEAIVDLLPPHQVLDLFQRIHTSFKVQLRGQLIRLGVTNDSGPQHGLVSADVAFYSGSLTSLQGLKKLDASMDAIWDKR